MATANTYDPILATSQGYNAQGYTANTAQAEDWNVADNQLVQNQVKGIIAADSPLMQQAATTAKQQMAGRGLLNSSMAIGAGQNAVILQALPMAQQDASTMANAAQFNAQNRTNVSLNNAGMLNEAARFGADSGNQAARFAADSANRVQQINADAQNRANEFGATAQNQFDLTAQQQAFQATQAGLDRQQQLTLADRQFLNQQSLQLAQQNFQAAQALLDRQQQTAITEVNQSYAQLAQLSSTAASIYNQYNNAVQAVLVSDLTTEAKQSAINQMTQFMKVGVQLQGSINGDVDLMSFFNSVWGGA